MPFVLIISLAGCIIGRNGQLERLVIGARSLAKGSADQTFEVCQLNSMLSVPAAIAEGADNAKSSGRWQIYEELCQNTEL